MAENFQKHIESVYGNLSKGHKKIADYIKENYEKASFMTAASLGKAVGVSESTVVRFAANIGFEGYPEGLRQVKNPYYFPDGIGDNGSDFTVGAVFVDNRIGNYFKGEIGGLAVYDRALSAEEVKYVSWWDKN